MHHPRLGPRTESPHRAGTLFASDFRTASAVVAAAVIMSCRTTCQKLSFPIAPGCSDVSLRRMGFSASNWAFKSPCKPLNPLPSGPTLFSGRREGHHSEEVRNPYEGVLDAVEEPAIAYKKLPLDLSAVPNRSTQQPIILHPLAKKTSLHSNRSPLACTSRPSRRELGG